MCSRSTASCLQISAFETAMLGCKRHFSKAAFFQNGFVFLAMFVKHMFCTNNRNQIFQNEAAVILFNTVLVANLMVLASSSLIFLAQLLELRYPQYFLSLRQKSCHVMRTQHKMLHVKCNYYCCRCIFTFVMHLNIFLSPHVCQCFIVYFDL